jgi:hypothetical protein
LKPSTRKLVLSSSDLRGAPLHVTFLVDRAISPREASLSSDERRLGFALVSFRYIMR